MTSPLTNYELPWRRVGVGGRREVACSLWATLPALAVLSVLSGTAGAVTVELGQSELDHLRQAQAVRDVEKIQNLMGRRTMLHSIGHDEEELGL